MYIFSHLLCPGSTQISFYALWCWKRPLWCGIGASKKKVAPKLSRHRKIQYSHSTDSLDKIFMASWIVKLVANSLQTSTAVVPKLWSRTSSGTRRPSRRHTNRPTLCFLHKKIYSQPFYLSSSVNKFLNFCVATLPLLVSKNGHHSHFLHVAFVLILVFQTFDRIIFGTLTFPETRRYVLTVRDPQMARDQKKFGNHWSTVWFQKWEH